jgi:hypothetical protein
MQIFMTKWFQRWAARETLTDDTLLAAVEEIGQGLIDADLGGHVVKNVSERVGEVKAVKAGELIEVNING